MPAESQLTERNPLNTDLSRAQHYSGFWQESSIPARTLAVATDDSSQTTEDCNLHGFECPEGFACVRYDEDPMYDTGPANQSPRYGECRAITPHIDWNGNGRLDDGIVTHLPAELDGVVMTGWSADRDCTVTRDDALIPEDEERRVWTLRESYGSCAWGEQFPRPNVTLPANQQAIDTTAEFCQTGALPRPRGLVSEAFDAEVPDGEGSTRTQSFAAGRYTQIYVPIYTPGGTDVVEDVCTWVLADHRFFDTRVSQDRNDFDELRMRWHAEAPSCSGVMSELAQYYQTPAPPIPSCKPELWSDHAHYVGDQE